MSDRLTKSVRITGFPLVVLPGTFAILLTLPGCIAPPPASSVSSEVPGAALPCPEQPTPPSVISGTSLPCPFPYDADRLGIHFAKVTLAVCVEATGYASSSLIVRDPGYGFAQAALQCIAEMRFQPGRDSSGNSAASRLVFNVKYLR